MRKVFVDTSAWAAMADRADSNHEIALVFRDEIAGQCQLITTDYILDELYTLLRMNVGYSGAISFKRDLDILRQAGILQVIWISEDLAQQAWQIFEQFDVDKEWSFTDCVSYVVMRAHNLVESFAFDHHFAQMGFLVRP
ncbi:MAG: type II toxin-antitoxin system VapC family toxin [Chloroflexi bacterium]|nr:type II toxin-antitoxin system VapC family toxin [Chloroflexota bacterium]